MRKCGKQITTTDGATVVTMKSGRVVSLHRCNIKKGHDSPCGYIGEIDAVQEEPDHRSGQVDEGQVPQQEVPGQG